MRNFIVRLIVAWARAHALPTADQIVVNTPKAKPAGKSGEVLI